VGYELIVPKLWGEERWIVNNQKYCAKLLLLKPGFRSSLHYHPVKDETFHILEGDCFLEIGSQNSYLAPTETIRIQPGVKHCFWTANPQGCTILEISTPHSDQDVVRLVESKAVV